MADSIKVANEFLTVADEQGRTLTPMQVLKLVYIAHGWSLALYGSPLVDQDVEAWQYGPVIPELYRAMKDFKSSSVRGPLRSGWGADGEELNELQSDLVRQVFQIYGHLNGVQLSRITHARNTPWEQTYSPGRFGTVIPTDVIADHYARLQNERRR